MIVQGIPYSVYAHEYRDHVIVVATANSGVAVTAFPASTTE